MGLFAKLFRKRGAVPGDAMQSGIIEKSAHSAPAEVFPDIVNAIFPGDAEPVPDIVNGDVDEENLQPHPFANLLPEMPDRDFVALCDNVRAMGLGQPIILYQGMILDGRHRYRACKAVGAEMRFEYFAGTDKDALEIVRSLNLFRRHMTASALAVSIAATAVSHEQAGQHAVAFGCSPRLAAEALTLYRAGDEELWAAVKAGKLSISRALQVIRGQLDRKLTLIDRRRAADQTAADAKRCKDSRLKIVARNHVAGDNDA